jgi:hypothetical protein
MTFDRTTNPEEKASPWPVFACLLFVGVLAGAIFLLVRSMVENHFFGNGL